MKITQEELIRRLRDPKNLSSLKSASSLRSEEKSKRGNDENNRNDAGRKADIPNAPKSLRLVAGVLAKAENNSSRVAENLDLTSGQVRYATGRKETKLTEKRVQEVALDRLMDAVGLLDLNTISNEKPKDIASIAANLSRVHKNLAPSNASDGSAVNITIYSPKQRSVKDYEIIEVQST